MSERKVDEDEVDEGEGGVENENGNEGVGENILVFHRSVDFDLLVLEKEDSAYHFQ